MASNHTGAFTFVVSRLLLVVSIIIRAILYPVRLLANILFPLHEFDGLSLNADKSARHFRAQNFSQCSTNPFFEAGYRSALSEANRLSKLCLVYLHSPLHCDSQRFLEMLKTEEVLAYFNNTTTLLNYGNSIHSADGTNAAQILKVKAYPFVALLGTENGDKAEIILRMEGIGDMKPDEFISRLRVCVEAQEGVLREADRRRRLREEEVRLRQEQDREFQQTLLADQLREAERLEAESISRNSVLRKQNTLAAARALLKTEPNCSESNVAKLRLTLPSGKKVDRRFYSNETLEHVQAFLRIYIEENGVNIENFSMSSSFPKRTFEDTSVTIDEAGLSPMAVIMVQDLDA